MYTSLGDHPTLVGTLPPSLYGTKKDTNGIGATATVFFQDAKKVPGYAQSAQLPIRQDVILNTIPPDDQRLPLGSPAKAGGRQGTDDGFITTNTCSGILLCILLCHPGFAQ